MGFPSAVVLNVPFRRGLGSVTLTYPDAEGVLRIENERAFADCSKLTEENVEFD